MHFSSYTSLIYGDVISYPFSNFAVAFANLYMKKRPQDGRFRWLVEVLVLPLVLALVLALVLVVVVVLVVVGVGVGVGVVVGVGVGVGWGWGGGRGGVGVGVGVGWGWGSGSRRRRSSKRRNRERSRKSRRGAVGVEGGGGWWWGGVVGRGGGDGWWWGWVGVVVVVGGGEGRGGGGGGWWVGVVVVGDVGWWWWWVGMGVGVAVAFVVVAIAVTAADLLWQILQCVSQQQHNTYIACHQTKHMGYRNGSRNTVNNGNTFTRLPLIMGKIKGSMYALLKTPSGEPKLLISCNWNICPATHSTIPHAKKMSYKTNTTCFIQDLHVYISQITCFKVNFRRSL